MKKNLRLAGWLALVGAGLGIIGNFLVFLNWYDILKVTPSAEPGCEILIKYIMPALSDLGIIGGVLYAVSAYSTPPMMPRSKSAVCRERLRILLRGGLGFPTGGDRKRTSTAGQLVHQRTFNGRGHASGLFPRLLAQSGPLLPLR